MKNTSTLVLKAALLAIGLGALAITIYLVPVIGRGWVYYFPGLINLQYIFMGVLYCSAVTFWIALGQAYKILRAIDANKAFSVLSVRALRAIKLCGIADSALYTVCLPFIYMIAEMDDAPGLILIGLILVAASLVVSVFAAVLQKLIESAIKLQEENDLTV